VPDSMEKHGSAPSEVKRLAPAMLGIAALRPGVLHRQEIKGHVYEKSTALVCAHSIKWNEHANLLVYMYFYSCGPDPLREEGTRREYYRLAARF
jgi:hypothetical protein